MRIHYLVCLTALFILSSFTGLYKKGPRLPKEFRQVPAGTMWIDSVNSHTVESFYISKYEVSNEQYSQFYHEVSPGLSEAERRKIAVDSTGWDKVLENGKAVQRFYHIHDGFKNYPVVNISHAGAERYCEWLQQKLQEQNPDYEIKVQLPTQEQWIWAARGGRSQAMFPWGNYYLRDKKGNAMCNFRTVSDHSIYRNRSTGKPEIAIRNDNRKLTSAIKSYVPNDYGLYNMCGNAAEMVMENKIAMGGSWNDFGGDVHIMAKANYDGPLPTVGFRPVLMARKKGR